MQNRIADDLTMSIQDQRKFKEMKTQDFMNKIQNSINDDLTKNILVNNFKSEMYDLNMKKLKAFSALGISELGEVTDNKLVDNYIKYIESGGEPLPSLDDNRSKNFKSNGLIYKLLPRIVKSSIPGGIVLDTINDTMNLYATADAMNDILMSTNILSKAAGMNQINEITNNIINNIDLNGMCDEYDSIINKMDQSASNNMLSNIIESIDDVTSYNKVKAGMAISGYHPSYTKTHGITMMMTGDNTISNIMSDIINKFV